MLTERHAPAVDSDEAGMQDGDVEVTSSAEEQLSAEDGSPVADDGHDEAEENAMEKEVSEQFCCSCCSIFGYVCFQKISRYLYRIHRSCRTTHA